MLLDAGPAFAVALVFAAGVIFWTQRWQGLERALKKIGGSLPLAAGIGALLPGCALSTVPLALVLRQHGAPIGTVTAFMVTSAVLGPSSVILTALMLDWQITALRIILPLGAVLVLGGGLNLLADRKFFSAPALGQARAAIEKQALRQGLRCDRGPTLQGCNLDGPAAFSFSTGEETGWRDHGHSHDYSTYSSTLWGMSRTLVPLLLIGLMSVSLLRYLIPPEFIQTWLQGGGFAYLAAAAGGIPAYVCEGGEVPLTLALLNLGVGLGPALTFMLAAVGTCLPTLLLAPRIIGVGATATYALFWLIFAVGAGVLIVTLV